MNKCIFKNFRECYRQEVQDDDPKKYDYTICSACLLSRMEKMLFNYMRPKDGKDVQGDRQASFGNTQNQG